MAPIFRKSIRRARTFLRGPKSNRWGIREAALSRASQTAYWQMRAFYLVAFVAAFDYLRTLYDIAISSAEPEYLWPAFWAKWVGLETAGRLVGLSLPLACAAALWRPGATWPRILVFLAFLQFSALENSFGSINHWTHYFIWISFVMMFMPRGDVPVVGASTSRHYAFIFGIFAAQCFVGLFYTLSGFNKFLSGFPSGADRVSSFAPDALPLLIMARWDETGSVPFFAEFFARNTFLAWPAHLLVMYFELVFLVAVCRPQLHRLFGFIFAAFHLGVWLTMGITFAYQPVLVALLFVWSPMAYFDRATIGQRLAQVPIIDLAFWGTSLLKRK